MGLPKSTYDITKSYEWNYEHGPVFQGEIPKFTRNPSLEFLGFNINNPIGVPAGPLLSSKYIELYANLGFDILSYKTVRSVKRDSHPAPNCVYIPSTPITHDAQDTEIHPVSEPETLEKLSITNSFGMPSMHPDVWMPDVEKAKRSLHEGQVLVVSIVGTRVEERSYVDDWAYTAGMARESNADIVELDISCPNVTSGAGQIYQDIDLTMEIIHKVRQALGSVPLLLKIGYIENDTKIAEMITRTAPYVQGIAAINTLRMKVVDKTGTQILPGEGRAYAGVCGAAIKSEGMNMTRKLVEARIVHANDMVIIGVGGIVTPEGFDDYLSLGADAAMSATGAMWDPLLAWKYMERKKSTV